MAKDDIYNIVDLKMVAYGNTAQESDGSFSCQHGAGECASDALELCLQYKLGDLRSISTGDTTKAAYPFILCMEEALGDPTQGETCYQQTMGSSNSTIPWSVINDCATQQPSLNMVQTEAMKTTALTDHTYVPWVLVDGELLDNSDLLLKSICDAYTGPAPKSCKRLMGVDQSRCYK